MSEQKRASKANAGNARGRGPAVVGGEEVFTPVIRLSFNFLPLPHALDAESSLSIALFCATHGFFCFY
jgi:hypothetical protein